MCLPALPSPPGRGWVRVLWLVTSSAHVCHSGKSRSPVPTKRAARFQPPKATRHQEEAGKVGCGIECSGAIVTGSESSIQRNATAPRRGAAVGGEGTFHRTSDPQLECSGDALHDLRRLSKLMFPDSNDLPSRLAKTRVDKLISCTIPAEFSPPIGAALRWHGAVVAAHVPEAAIYKNGKFFTLEYEIWPNQSARQVHLA